MSSKCKIKVKEGVGRILYYVYENQLNLHFQVLFIKWRGGLPLQIQYQLENEKTLNMNNEWKKSTISTNMCVIVSDPNQEHPFLWITWRKKDYGPHIVWPPNHDIFEEK